MTGTQREDKKLTEFGLAETLIAIHVEEARCELRKMRLQADVEVSSLGRPVRLRNRLLCQLGRLLVAMGRWLEALGRHEISPVRPEATWQMGNTGVRR